MSRYCRHCGAELDEGQPFCHVCGQPVAAVQPVVKKSKKGLVIVVGAVVLVVLVSVLAGTLLKQALANRGQETSRTTRPTTTAATSKQTSQTSAKQLELIPFPQELMLGRSTTVACNVKVPEVIIPANYRSLDYVVYLQCWTDWGTSDVLVSVEIPGFSQKYEQKIAVSRLETEISIRPPLLPDAASQLNSSKEAQIVLSVRDLTSDTLVLQESRPVKLYSRYDMQWIDANGTPYYENILAWVTPEAEEIRTLLRLAADSVNELTEGALNAIVGYQSVPGFSDEQVTYVQVISMMHALSAKLNVKYLMAPFSATSTELQRVATPAQVIQSAGGLCAETAVTIASAIQATDMHAVLIILPGHMQVAVETWRGSGAYFLIETTALDAVLEGNFDAVVDYDMDTAAWNQYLSGDGMIAIDCDLAGQLGILAID